MTLALLLAGALLAPYPTQPPFARGAEVYRANCAACHAAGPGHPGTAALAFRYGASEPAVLTERRDLPAEAVKLFVRQGINAMPFFRKTEISDADLDALAAYLSRH